MGEFRKRLSLGIIRHELAFRTVKVLRIEDGAIAQYLPNLDRWHTVAIRLFQIPDQSVDLDGMRDGFFAATKSVKGGISKIGVAGRKVRAKTGESGLELRNFLGFPLLAAELRSHVCDATLHRTVEGGLTLHP